MENESKRTILQQRAVLLAQRREASDNGARLHVVQFTIAGEHYAIEPVYVREVFRFNALTRVPNTPPFVVGIINVHGRVVSLLDLRVFFELPQRGLHDRSRALVLAAGAMEFGILIDGIDRTREIPVAQIETSLPSLSGVRAQYLMGVSADRVVILDGGRLLADPALVIGAERTDRRAYACPLESGAAATTNSTQEIEP